MIRGMITAAALVAGLLLAPSAQAKDDGYVVYELVRARPGGPAVIDVTMSASTEGGPLAVIPLLHLTPAGRGYRVQSINVWELGADNRYRMYGWPVAPVACPAAPACGEVGMRFGMSLTTSIRPKAGDRYFATGRRFGGAPLTVHSPYWRVQRTTLGFGVRAMTAERSKAMGVGARGINVERFTSATAYGGEHGSVAFARIPCGDYGVGSAQLSTEFAAGPTLDCAGAETGMFETQERTAWKLAGDVVGDADQPLRLLVFSFPRR